MNRNQQQFYAEQFGAFCDCLRTEWGIPKSFIDRVSDRLKSLHKRYLSLACTATIIGNRSACNEYSTGLIELSNLSMVLASKGVENTAGVLLRQTIEQTFKFIYFTAHPVEYSWSQTRIDYKDLTYQFLCNYICRTDELAAFIEGSDLLKKVGDKYAILSRYVHVHSKGFIGYKNPNAIYKPSESFLESFENHAKILWPILSALLLIFFPLKYKKTSDIEKRIIRKSLPRTLLVGLDEYLLAKG